MVSPPTLWPVTCATTIVYPASVPLDGPCMEVAKMSIDANRPAEAESAAAKQSPPPPKKRKRRWGRRLGFFALFLLIAIGLIVGFAPQIASSPTVYNYGLSVANNALKGRIALDGLSLSWGGPIEVRGLKVADPDGMQVVSVARVTAQLGLWSLIRSYLNLQTIEIDSPDITIILTPDNKVTVAEAFSPRTPSPKTTTSSPLPEPRGRIVLKDGTVRVVRAGSGEYAVTKINGDVTLASLSEIAGQLSAQLDRGPTLSADIATKGLVSDGGFSAKNATGTLKLGTNGPIDLKHLTSILMPGAGLDGTLSLKVDGAFSPGDIQATLDINSVDLKSASVSNVNPIDLALRGTAKMTNEKITAHADLAGEAGAAAADISYVLSEKPIEIDAQKIVSAILQGDSLTLPDFTLSATASIDLAAVERAVPGVLKIREGQQITGGRLEIASLGASGGKTPSARGALEVKGITVASGDKTITAQPVTLDFDAALEAGKGLNVRRLGLRAVFASLAAEGLPTDLNAQFEADLTKLQNELGQIIDLGAMNLSGNVHGLANLTKASDEKFTFALNTKARGFNASIDGKPISITNAILQNSGAIALSKGKPGRITAEQLQVDLDGQVIASGVAWYDLSSNGYSADLAINKADLSFVTGKIATLAGANMGEIKGVLSGQVKAEKPAGDKPLTSNGTLTTKGLAVDGQVLSQQDAVIGWSGTTVSANYKQIGVEQAKVQSDFATLNATNVKWDAANAAAINLNVDATADLQKVMNLVGQLAKMEKPPAIGGQLKLTSTAGASGSNVSVRGNGEITQFTVGVGEKAVREDKVGLEFDATIDPKAEKITLGKTQMSSKPFSAELTGSVDQYAKGAMLNLKGRYDAQWEPITTLLHELFPDTKKIVAVQGTSSSEITVTGPASKPEVVPTYRGVAGATNVGWNGADLYGIGLGQALLAPKLAEGQVQVPPAKVPAGGGQLLVAGNLDLTKDEPTFVLAGQNRIVDNVQINVVVAEMLLSYINPFFMQVTKIEGAMFLDTQDVYVPLGDKLKTDGRGKGRLELKQARLVPNGGFAELLNLMAITGENIYIVEISGFDFELKQGRIYYNDLWMRFAGGSFDLKFYGSVGLDGSLELVVSIPISDKLLAKLGISGPVVEYAKALAGTRVEVPVSGTREKPKLDFSRVDTKALMKNVAQEAGKGLVEEGLKGLLRGDDKDDPNAPKKDKKPKLPPIKIPGKG